MLFSFYTFFLLFFCLDQNVGVTIDSAVLNKKKIDKEDEDNQI